MQTYKYLILRFHGGYFKEVTCFVFRETLKCNSFELFKNGFKLGGSVRFSQVKLDGVG